MSFVLALHQKRSVLQTGLLEILRVLHCLLDSGEEKRRYLEGAEEQVLSNPRRTQACSYVHSQHREWIHVS